MGSTVLRLTRILEITVVDVFHALDSQKDQLRTPPMLSPMEVSQR